MFLGVSRVVSATALLVWIGFAMPSIAAAEVLSAGPSDDIEALINALQPGDELILSGGMYILSERFSFAIAGTENAPITIRAAEGEVPHLHRPNANQNIIDIDQAVYVTIRGIEFSGGSAGIRISGARFLTIEDCEVHDTGDVAIRANDTGVTYESLRILGNHIHHTNNTGGGMYLGCNNAGCEVADSLIEGNYIHHTNQPSVSQGDGIELKEGSSGNVIRDNVIHDTNYPCILTYASNGAANIIERNAMWNCGDHGIQSAADAVIRNNIILGASADGIAMQPHQSESPSELMVVHNTVLNAGGNAVSLRGISGSVVVANNALYAQDGHRRLSVLRGRQPRLGARGDAEGIHPDERHGYGWDRWRHWRIRRIDGLRRKPRQSALRGLLGMQHRFVARWYGAADALANHRFALASARTKGMTIGA